MLGVDGGPRLNPVAPGRPWAKPALALVVEGSVYLVDAGYDTARQLVASGLGFGDVGNVFITHHHFDHTSGLPGLALHGWTAPRSMPALKMWGPPTTTATASGIQTAFAEATALFSTGDGFGPQPVLAPTDVVLPDAPGVHPVMEDDRVLVEATRVFHGPEVAHAYAYRFTLKRTGKVAVFSGDSAAPDANLIELARDCDVLVHEVQDNDNVQRIADSFPSPEQGAVLKQHLLEAHSDVRDVPRVAHAAGAGRVVFSHYTPLPQAPETYLAKAQAVADEIGYRVRSSRRPNWTSSPSDGSVRGGPRPPAAVRRPERLTGCDPAATIAAQRAGSGWWRRKKSKSAVAVRRAASWQVRPTIVPVNPRSGSSASRETSMPEPIRRAPRPAGARRTARSRCRSRRGARSARPGGGRGRRGARCGGRPRPRGCRAPGSRVTRSRRSAGRPSSRRRRRRSGRPRARSAPG